MDNAINYKTKQNLMSLSTVNTRSLYCLSVSGKHPRKNIVQEMVLAGTLAEAWELLQTKTRQQILLLVAEPARA